jgi:glucuronyl/N-acetylglucosaminyl transferase EXT1
MNAKMRYLMLLLSTIFLLLCYYSGKKLKRKLKPASTGGTLQAASYLSMKDIAQMSRQTTIPGLSQTKSKHCRMETCFNFSRCAEDRFRVYIYPYDESLVPSDSYAKILNAVTESAYFTAEAEEACLFVLSLDTLDRDVLSQVRDRLLLF